jgi:protein phosphatase 2C family protein 2/3
MSKNRGKKVVPLSTDHKPCCPKEKARILDSKGQIYQTATVAQGVDEKGKLQPPEIIIGPVRVFPGRLSVCRTFGDWEAKKGASGNINVVVAKPEIRSFTLEESHDFIILGCDGIFDKLSDTESVDCVWNTVSSTSATDVHTVVGEGAECIMKNALNRRSLDNVTVVIIGFDGF